jgi:hypothetical protein
MNTTFRIDSIFKLFPGLWSVYLGKCREAADLCNLPNLPCSKSLHCDYRVSAGITFMEIAGQEICSGITTTLFDFHECVFHVSYNLPVVLSKLCSV